MISGELAGRVGMFAAMLKGVGVQWGGFSRAAGGNHSIQVLPLYPQKTILAIGFRRRDGTDFFALRTFGDFSLDVSVAGLFLLTASF